MIGLLILLMVLLTIFNMIIYNKTYKCPISDEKIISAKGSRLPNEESILDTIKIKLNKEIKCGIYQTKSFYGNGILIVGFDNYNVGYLKLPDMESLNKINVFDLWDLTRLHSDKNDFIKTYNRGCC